LSRSSSYIHNAKLELAKTQSIVYKSQLHKKINATLNGVQWPNLIWTIVDITKKEGTCLVVVYGLMNIFMVVVWRIFSYDNKMKFDCHSKGLDYTLLLDMCNP